MLVDRDGNEYVVFDDHSHMGARPNVQLGSSSLSPEEKIAAMDACGVDMAVCFPMLAPHTDYRDQNELMLGAMERYPDRLVAFTRIQPLFKEKAVADIHDYASRGARGLKLHPFMDFGGNAVNNRELMFPLMEAASEHRMTVLIHSGESWNSVPSLIGDLAENFPDVKFIIGHSGLWEFHQQAIVVARKIPNVYLDTAEITPPGAVTALVREVGADRVLFGADHPFLPYGFELGKVVKYCGLAPDEIRLVLGENLARLLGVDIRREGRRRVELAAI